MDCRLPSVTIAREPLSPLVDSFGRNISYLRLSLTDRCNLRCFYCMQKRVTFVPKSEVLSLEELERVAAAFIRLGVRKLRLTGGEPLVRPGVMQLVERLGRWVDSGDLDELTLTTNGTRLTRYAPGLAAAGMRRINVSLDTLDEGNFRRITGHEGLSSVLAGIDAARAAGLAVRVNMVAMASVNDDEFDRMIRWCGDHDCDLALIEVMPLGMVAENYLPLTTVRQALERHWTLTPLDDFTGGPGRYCRVEETGSRVAFIAPMSHKFCEGCNRVRLTCTGRLVPCLGQREGSDLRSLLRGDGSDDELERGILAAVARKPAGHDFDARRPVEVRPMWHMGG